CDLLALVGRVTPVEDIIGLLETTFDEDDVLMGLFPDENVDGDATFEVKEPEFEVEKPESEVHVSPSSSAKTKKHDDKTKREAKGKSLVEVNAASTPVPAISPTHGKSSYVDTSQYPDDPNMPALEDITCSDDEEDVGAEADFTNLETTITVSPIPTTRVHKDYHVTQIIGDLSLATQTRSMTMMVKDQGHTQEEGIDYEEVFAPVARIEAIRLFLAYASFIGFMVYQMDVKSAFLYGTIEKEVYVCQPLRFEDPDYPDKVYKVVKALYELHQAPRAWYETLANYLLENGFQRGKIDQTLFIKKQKGDILLVQVYVDDIIFGSNNKDLCKAFEKLMKDKFQMSSMGELTFFLGLQDLDGEDVDVHTYRSMIGSLMYLTSSRPDIMFAICACARFQAIPKASHLHELKRIFRYLKGKPHLVLWYPKDSPFNLVAYSDSDYAGTSLDRKSTTGGCQFLGCKLTSWQWKKQTVVATSSTEAEYVAAASYCAQEKVIIIENTIREALQLDDTKSIDCLPNEEIFTELARMGYEKPSTKLTNYKAFFSAQWKMLVPQQAAAVDDVVDDSVPTDDVAVDVPTADEVREEEEVESVRVEKIAEGGIIAKINADEDVILEEVDAEKDAKVVEKNANVQGRPEESQAKVYHIDLEHADKVLITAATTTIIVATINAAPTAARRRKGVVIRDPEETATLSTIIHSEPKSKDKGKGIMVEEAKPLKKQEHVKEKGKQDIAVLRYQALKRKPHTEAQARKNMMVYLKNMAGFKMDYFKGIIYDDIRPIFEKYFNSNVAFLEKSKEQLEEEESRALKRTSECLEEKAAKKQKLDEEVEEIKKHLQIVPNDDDDVYTKATPLALKVLVVDYEIYSKNNKPYYKILRADGSHQLFLSFLSLLKNFDRDDLEMLWQIVPERFTSSKPKNFSDDFLLTTLTYMFEKPDVEAQVWKNQRGVHGLAKVKSWRLLESCGVHIITFTTTQMILLVERRYPLTRFTVDQMLNNVRLEVEEESEVSLKLLRFIRQQQQEGYRPE
nr:putative ribonuclease H-like domain-containing protein [Tanacetum cinerariifolium]